MHTLKSRRYKKCGEASALAARFARMRDKRRQLIASRPSPEYPPDLPASGEWLAAFVHGQLVVIHLHRMPSHRTDQWGGTIDGRIVSDAAGMTVLCTALRQAIGRVPSRRAYATLQSGFSEQDEQDAKAANERGLDA